MDNLDSFERKDLPEIGWHIVYKGTSTPIDGMAIVLKNAQSGSAFNENNVRIIMAKLSLGVPLEYYETLSNDPDAQEAIRRSKEGVRVINTDSFEYILLDERWAVVYAGTLTVIEGSSVILYPYD